MSETDSNLSSTANEIIRDLQRVADKLETTPTANNYDEHGEFSVGKIQYWFESWNTALTTAGLTPNQRTVTSDEEVLDELRAWVESLQQPPTQELLENEGPYSTHVYVQVAGSCNKALRAAGVEPARERPIPRESLIADFRRVATDLDKILTRNEYNKYGSYSPTPFENNWGKWSSVKATIDVPGIDV